MRGFAHKGTRIELEESGDLFLVTARGQKTGKAKQISMPDRASADKLFDTARRRMRNGLSPFEPVFDNVQKARGGGVRKARRQTIDDATIQEVRERQGEVGVALDNQARNNNVAPKVAITSEDVSIQNQWLADPGDADIIGVDFVSPFRRPGPVDRPAQPRKEEPADPKEITKGKFPYQIVGGSEKQRKQIDESLRRNFTADELKESEGMVIEIGRGNAAQSGAAAFYVYRAGDSIRAMNSIVSRKAASIPGLKHYIKLGKEFGDVGISDAITHEYTHHLRAKRLERGEGKLTKRKDVRLIGLADSDIEESATDLESVSRHNPFTNRAGNVGRPTQIGYYQHLVPRKGPFGEVDPFQIASLELQDRAIVTLSRKKGKLTEAEIKKAKEAGTLRDEKLRTSGKKGQTLTDRIEARFADTAIANFKRGGNLPVGRRISGDRIKGKVENVDQYFAVIKADGRPRNRIHYRATSTLQDLTDDIKALASDDIRPGEALVEFNDGKVKRLAGSSAAVDKFKSADAAGQRPSKKPGNSLNFGKARRGIKMRPRGKGLKFSSPKLVKSRREARAS